MKKIILVILIFLIAFFVINNESPENTTNESEEIVIQGNQELENITPNAVAVDKEADTLEGKTIAFIGDSLIEGYGNNYHGFDYYLSQELPNTNFINNSKSGSTITDNSGNDNIVMINQAKTLTGNPDIIVFDGGANDIMGYALGFLNNDLKKEIGTIEMNPGMISSGDTVMSDLEEVVLELKNTFPNAKLCYLQPFLLDDDTISHLTEQNELKQEILSRRDKFYAEIKKLCTKWNVEYLDVSTNFVGTGTTYRQDDWIHIKEEGYQLLVPYLLNKLKEM